MPLFEQSVGHCAYVGFSAAAGRARVEGGQQETNMHGPDISLKAYNYCVLLFVRFVLRATNMTCPANSSGAV